jgi:putative membrane protein
VEGKELFAAVNSCLNGLSTLLLIAAYVFVRKRKYAAHGVTMSLALLSSAVFLACYLYSHYRYGQLSMDIPMGWFKGLYLAILFPHLLLAILMLPGIIAAVALAAMRRWPAHVRVVRYTWPTWLFVSITGIVVYLMLYQVFPVLYPEAYDAAIRSTSLRS